MLSSPRKLFVTCTRRRVSQTICFLKFIFEKAYDRVNQQFLHHTLYDFGFSNALMTLIIHCVICNLSLVWNGEKLQNFALNRGLYREDPLSPYLFILCMEKLALLIVNKVKLGAWLPVKVSRPDPANSHLFFASSYLLFVQAKSSQAWLVSYLLDDFWLTSSLQVNLEKSKFMAFRNLPRSKVVKFVGITSMHHTTNFSKYLGFPPFQGQVHKQEFNFIVEKLNLRLVGVERLPSG